ncbi:hypothetical protein TMatcc_003790 [Talaromyces marneffei ATCC 18224]|uniref:JmjC domain protein, putative n=2 Tax=Talaromyces marneffei TaxID=37727 RepID=B6Q228_TALMQ|nr:uncharacterized protein EYB26_001206 [Talaromyces marneffei]EEA27910.1 JmjC domain protein, putative [Talaromyces marneffei ATCC 18224]KAE8556426.1 hypothetical protein EYB25_001127 [Talaromyces marneffei]QGA13556.1 hypothetical protein EYB26_001206 [Talaromyces marneffei]
MGVMRIYGQYGGIISHTVRPKPIRPVLQQHQISSLTTITHWIPPDNLPDENDIDHFRQHYFTAEKPAVFRSADFARNLQGYQKWFVEQKERGVRLNYEYISQYGDAVVPLEMTTTTTSSEPSSGGGEQIQFKRLHAPLSMFLAYTQSPPSPQNKTTIYLAQAHISDLPPQLSSDFSPAPRIVTETGKNDIYAANLWIGAPPTYTPLHKDPNPNLFVQLAGLKHVRLLGPGDGMGVFMYVRNQVASDSGNGGGGAAIRGEEMMMGLERKLLEDVIWGDNHSDTATDSSGKGMVGYDVLLERGDVLFIPKGWWHSLKGVGEGITSSVNWWFR